MIVCFSFREYERYNFSNHAQSQSHVRNPEPILPVSQSGELLHQDNQSNDSRQASHGGWGSVFKDRASFVEMHVM